MILVAFSNPFSMPKCIIPQEKPKTTHKSFLHKNQSSKDDNKVVKQTEGAEPPALWARDCWAMGIHSRLWWLGSRDPRCQGKEALAAGAPGAGHLSCWERTPLCGPEGQERHLPAWISCLRCQCFSSTGIKQSTGQAGEAGTALLLLAKMVQFSQVIKSWFLLYWQH